MYNPIKPATLGLAAALTAAPVNYSALTHNIESVLNPSATVTQDVGSLMNRAYGAEASKISSRTHSLPELSGRKPFWKTTLDIFTDIDGEETVARYYKAPNGEVVATLHLPSQRSKKEVLYGYIVNIDLKTGSNGGALIDSNGNSDFIYLGPGTKFQLNDWLHKHRISG